MDTDISDPSPLLSELRDRLPESFKLVFPEIWKFEALLEVIEQGTRAIIDAIQVANWEEAFKRIIDIHRLLLHREVATIDAALSQCAKGRDLAELMARGLLITVLHLTHSQNMAGTANTETWARFPLEGIYLETITHATHPYHTVSYHII